MIGWNSEVEDFTFKSGMEGELTQKVMCTGELCRHLEK